MSNSLKTQNIYVFRYNNVIEVTGVKLSFWNKLKILFSGEDTTWKFSNYQLTVDGVKIK